MKSDSINEIAAALAKAQAEFGPVRRSAENPFFQSKYADLEAYRAATVPALSKNGLAVTQLAHFTDARVCVVTMLMHSSGQWFQGEMSMRPAKDDPQAIGSCLTYIRRYAYAAILGCASEDDDGNTATHQPAPAPEPPASKPLKKKAPDGSSIYTCSDADKIWLVSECKAAQVLDIETQKIMNGLMEGKPRNLLAQLITDARKELGL